MDLPALIAVLVDAILDQYPQYDRVNLTKALTSVFKGHRPPEFDGNAIGMLFGEQNDFVNPTIRIDNVQSGDRVEIAVHLPEPIAPLLVENAVRASPPSAVRGTGMTRHEERKPWGTYPIIGLFVLVSISLSIGFALFLNAANSDRIELQGRIINAEGGMPIADAKVSLTMNNTPPIVYSDAEGIFRLTLLVEADRATGKIVIQKEGFAPYDRLIDVQESTRVIEDIRMTPLIGSPSTLPGIITPSTIPPVATVLVVNYPSGSIPLLQLGLLNPILEPTITETFRTVRPPPLGPLAHDPAFPGMVQEYRHEITGLVQYERLSVDDHLLKVEVVCPDYRQDVTSRLSSPFPYAGDTFMNYGIQPILVPHQCAVVFTVGDTAGATTGITVYGTRTMVRSFLMTKPDDPDGHLHASDAFYKEDLFLQAIDAATNVINEMNGTQSPYTVAIAHQYRGRAYAKLGNDLAALADFTEAIRLGGSYANIGWSYQGRAEIWDKRKECDKAFTDWAIFLVMGGVRTTEMMVGCDYFPLERPR